MVNSSRPPNPMEENIIRQLSPLSRLLIKVKKATAVTLEIKIRGNENLFLAGM
jgi:hypothetical protein